MIRDIHHTSNGWLEGSSGSDKWDRTPRGLQPHDPMDTPWHAGEWVLGMTLLVIIVSATCVLAWLGRAIITQAGIYDVLSAMTR
jgi:hypothetical protein